MTRVLVLLAWLMFPPAVDAATLKDVKIGLHVIDFVIGSHQDRSILAIAYDPRTKESAEDAQSILESLNASLMHGSTALKPVMIDIRDLDDQAGVRAVMVADHMKPFYDKLSAFGRRTSTLILSTDLDCVRAGKCTVGIASSPRVEVIVSSQQAQASAILFSEAFRMMVTEY